MTGFQRGGRFTRRPIQPCATFTWAREFNLECCVKIESPDGALEH
jgi:hypothetical protein